MGLSIIIPTFNEAKLIERTLQGIKVHPAKYEWLWSPVR